MNALIVIDIQNDYLWDKRKPKFTYNTNKVITNINNTINKYKKDHDIIYISHLINNLPTNKLLFGYSIKGTEGAKLYKDLNIVSNYLFNKYLPSAYTSKKFKEFMKEKNYKSIKICGLDEGGCVYHTTLSAIKYNKDVSIVKDSTFTCLDTNNINKKRNKLISLGVKYV